MSNRIPSLELNQGGPMPQLGLGVWQIADAQVPAAVQAALEAGYRSIDTAAVYGNEAAVGAAIRQSGIARSELYITTKLWNDSQGRERTLRAFDASLKKLDCGYIDLYLIHWPLPRLGLYLETWKTLEELRRDGRVKAIGVSNFQPAHLQRLIDESGTVPAVNQVELHPFLQQRPLRGFHKRHGIVTEAWSPLAQSAALRHPALVKIAARHRRSVAQIVLRWHIEQGIVAIPKSATPARVRENAALFDFQLSPEDLSAISALDQGRRVGPDPDTFAMGAQGR
ncbi:MAG TPA: aldo/keto reductase [Nevskiaceae bacterium]|nr:aldo/keto reductase [Nevskiaceae bacterium]